MVRVKLIRAVSDEDGDGYVEGFSRGVELPFPPTEGMMIVDDDFEFSCDTVGYTVREDEYWAYEEIVVPSDLIEETVLQYISSGWWSLHLSDEDFPQ
jgi:hypothetical protein